MAYSMTGYGRAEGEGFGKRITIEIKTINHRYLDIVFRMPKTLMAYEDRLKKTMQKRIFRGRVEIYINIEQIEGNKDKTVFIDKDLMLAYYNDLEKLREELKIDQKITMDLLVNLPDSINIIEKHNEDEEFIEMMESILNNAMMDLLKMREAEGVRLAEYLLSSITLIGEWLNQIEKIAPLVVEEYRKKLQDKLIELVPEEQLDGDRLMMEVVLFADKCDITEEITRLRSHLISFNKIIGEKGPLGKKLDFLIQEINREINTIGSKANNLEISKLIVTMKTEMEKIREQVQNLE